ncbi:MAG: glycosyltransferase family 2 protein [Bacteroidales bacterium]|nr:glycosyltransferase family 2 protein [Bacteroidales bacterium]MBR0300509.1 glycosyltransferase family 2 protein [Bacteroidales bacterium]
MKFSIIIPVYNAARTLPESLESIRRQHWRDFELIFVEDGSTDGSAELLEAFAASADFPCHIVSQLRNGGVAAARNRGLAAACGDYLAFVDADDRIEPEALEEAAHAIDSAEEVVDIVGWDWTLGFEKNGRVMHQADYDLPLQALKNLMGGTMRWNLWLFAVRRELLLGNGIHFIDGANMGEDMMLMLKAFCKAGKVVQLHKPLYRYNAVSETSLSRQFSPERRREISENLAGGLDAIAASAYAAELEPYGNHLKLFLKLPLLISADRSNYETWSNWFPESNAYAMANRALPLRTRLLQGLAARRCWGAVKLYYLLVYKFVYGLIYR